MNSDFKIINIDDAIKRLQSLKKKNNKQMVVICTIDFDNDQEIGIKKATPDEGCTLIKKSKSIIMNEDEFLSHMELYSIEQNNIENIIKKGVVHDIIFSG